MDRCPHCGSLLKETEASAVSAGPEMTPEQLQAMYERMKPTWQPIVDCLRGDAP